jgi:5-methylcytosine-specific restriction endonuclease McrBC regulatory subunit McrC
MRNLVPDCGMRGGNRLVWVDAKYKAHLQQLAQRGWSGLEESVREAHRADLHQALAYASLEQVEHVDSLLVYPQLSTDMPHHPAIATVGMGQRRVRLLLVSLPFGFQSPDQREATLAQWREFLAA